MTTLPTRGEVLESLRVLQHPTRMHVLVAMSDGRDHSARTLAAAIDGDVPLTAYHVRFLAREGFIRLQRTRQVRGAVAHGYRITGAGRDAVAPLLALPD